MTRNIGWDEVAPRNNGGSGVLGLLFLAFIIGGLIYLGGIGAALDEIGGSISSVAPARPIAAVPPVAPAQPIPTLAPLADTTLAQWTAITGLQTAMLDSLAALYEGDFIRLGRALVMMPGVGDVVWGMHMEKHPDAFLMIAAATSCGVNCLYRCDGGKWYYLPELVRNGVRILGVVIGGGDTGYTAFPSSDWKNIEDSLARDRCNKVIKFGHDGMSGPIAQ
jgi:hypothetical protein